MTVNAGPAGPGSASPASTVVTTSNLAALAASAEPRSDSWQQQFERLLASRAVSTLQRDRLDSVGGDALAGQIGLRFQRVPDDQQEFSTGIEMLARRIAPVMAAGRKVCIDLTQAVDEAAGLDLSESALPALTEALEAQLPAALSRFGLVARGLMFSLRVDQPELEPFLQLRESFALGRPKLTLRLPNSMMSRLHTNAVSTAESDTACSSEADSRWALVTQRSHEDRGIALVFEATTMLLSDLHSAERCDVALPQSLFEAPADSAWLALRLDVSELADSAAGIGFQRLRPMLRVGLRFADNLVDHIDWPWASLRLDAMLNRRVAVHLVGIGDLVDGLGLDPCEFRTLQLVTRLLVLLKRVLIRESAALARRRGPFPGLGVRDLVMSLAPHYGHEDAERLIRQRSLRHRHLLAISPYAIFPSRPARHPVGAYKNLLPAIGCADTINMYEDPLCRSLSLGEYRRLVRRTWAVSRNRS